MDTLAAIAFAVLLFASTASALVVAYLVVLTAVAAIASRSKVEPRHVLGSVRLLVIVPAHNEADLLPDLAASIHAQTLPRGQFDVHVVADNCTDATAAIAQAAGFITHERHNTTHRGKGHALDWLMKRLKKQGIQTNAFVYIDADSRISSNCLEVIARRFAEGEQAVQVFYGVAAPETSWSKAARAAAMLLVNYVRPLGRSRIGGSAGVKGTGMAFSPSLVQDHAWGGALAEDAEFHLDLVLGGHRVAFEPAATVLAHVPASLEAAETQNRRWEAGRIDLVRSFVPRLLGQFIRGRGILPLDAAIDLLIPPLSVLAAILLVNTAFSAFLEPSLLTLNFAALAGLAIHVVAGMAIGGATWVHYKALLMSPVFILWKVRLYLPILAGRRPVGWLKTERD